ncbi:MAG TPA: SpoIIE family protein phosphatase [Fervidobacterium sp.]|nr:SpoIIE family protein phosphatase [Fervidobacterium sp.]
MTNQTLTEYLKEKDSLEFLDDISMPAYVVNKARTIVFWNRAARELTGYMPQEVVGKRCADQILNHVDKTGIPLCSTDLCPLYQSMKNGSPVQLPFSVYGLTKSGKRKPFSIFGLPIKTEDGEVLGGIELFTDAENADKDMSLAIKIQQAFVPKDEEHIEFFYRPSAGLGGDMIYYNFPWIGIIDISGHGVAASLISMLLRTVVDTVIAYEPHINNIPFLIENELTKYQLEGLYFTGIIGKLEGSKYKFIDIGHPSPINIATSQVLETNNVIPVGFGFSEEYSDDVVNVYDLNDGPLFIYTDGISELETKDGMLGSEGLAKMVSKDDNLSSIYLKTLKLRKSPVQSDDVTMILLRNPIPTR